MLSGQIKQCLFFSFAVIPHKPMLVHRGLFNFPFKHTCCINHLTQCALHHDPVQKQNYCTVLLAIICTREVQVHNVEYL